MRVEFSLLYKRVNTIEKCRRFVNYYYLVAYLENENEHGCLLNVDCWIKEYLVIKIHNKMIDK